VGDSSYMPDVRADGRFRVIQAEGNRTKVGTETAGWLLGDEFDMSDGPSIKCPAMLNSSKAGVPAGRMRVANWARAWPCRRAIRSGRTAIGGRGSAEQDCWTNGVNVDSVDLYWFTDPYQGSSTRYGCLYGENI
jgi:hypothetical protein